MLTPPTASRHYGDTMPPLLGALSALLDLPRRIEHMHQTLCDVQTALARTQTAISGVYNKPHTVSVFYIGSRLEDDVTHPAYASWSVELAPDEKRELWVTAQMPIKGGYLIGLNGALLENVRVGARAQDISQSLGPIAVIKDTVSIGMQLRFTVRYNVPNSPW